MLIIAVKARLQKHWMSAFRDCLLKKKNHPMKKRSNSNPFSFSAKAYSALITSNKGKDHNGSIYRV
jgi:hypothetical protein